MMPTTEPALADPMAAFVPAPNASVTAPEPREAGAPEAPPGPGPSLDDAISGPPGHSGPANPAPKTRGKPIADEQILGIFGGIFARGLDPATREQFIEAYRQDELVRLGLEFSDLGGALMELGITVGSNTMSPWLKLGIGAAALIGGGLLLRSSYAQQGIHFEQFRNLLSDPNQRQALFNQLGITNPDGGFTAADLGEPATKPAEETYADFAV